MFKKHSLVIALGAMFAVPAFADATAEAIIYQADQTDATANINQVIVDGIPQSAAILQLDALATGDRVNNYATVIQGNTSGSGSGVTVDPTGTTANNVGTDAGALLGAGEIAPYAAPDLTAYTDQQTTLAPFESQIIGVDSFNYALTYQDHQSGSSALVVQALGADLGVQVPEQASLANGDIPANAGDIVNPLEAGDGTVVSIGHDYVSDLDVTTTFDTGGALTVDYGAASGPATLSDADSVESSSNVAIITQGANLDFTSANSNTVAADLADVFDGTDVSNNVALVIQASIDSYARIGQQGTLNTSIVYQKSDADGSNVAESYQYSNDVAPIQEFSLISQNGNFNVAQSYQAGTTNSSYVFQFGDGNTSVVDQFGVDDAVGGAVAFVYQSNSAAGGGFNTGNYASIYQHTAP